MNAWTIALDSIWHHKLRSTLTALGVVIGVFAVVSLTSLGAGVKAYMTNKFDQIGATLITVAPAAPGTEKKLDGGAHRARGPSGGGGFSLSPAPSTLTVADAQAIAHLGAQHGVAAVAPVAQLAAIVAAASSRVPATVASATPAPIASSPSAASAPSPSRSPSAASATAPAPTSLATVVIGTTAPYFGLQHLAFLTGGVGQGFTSGAVLGLHAAQQLFGLTAPGAALGRSLTVNGQRFQVVAVLRSAPRALGSDPNDAVYIPLQSALAGSGSHFVAEIMVGATGTGTVDSASAAVRHLMDQRHPLQDFLVVTNSQILGTIQSTLSVVTGVLAGIAAISLVVGGIGIMNIMLVTVTERVREIGVRKALGAGDGDILVQFLVESVLLAVLGGAIGVLLAAVVAGIVSGAIHVPIGVTGTAIGVALAFCVIVGMVFGVLPAMNAARLMPADALRSE